MTVPSAKREQDNIYDNTQDIRELGQAIAYYRKYRGLTQENLAERLGMEFLQGGNLVTWYSLFCYGERDGGEKGGDGACC